MLARNESALALSRGALRPPRPPAFLTGARPAPYRPGVLTLEGRSALVTGGSRGIGRAICTHFGMLGARVAVNYRSDEVAAGEAVAAVQWVGGEAFAVRADVSKPDEAG